MGCFASTISAVKSIEGRAAVRGLRKRAGSRAAAASCNHSRPAQASAQFSFHSLPVVRMFTLSDFDFDLPPELIAQVALPERSAKAGCFEVDNAADADRAARASSTAASPNCPTALRPAICWSSTIPKS